MKRVGYLSAAPRVSTHPEAEAAGPRSHVLGVIKAFENLKWDVKRFIVGDRLPVSVGGKGSEKILVANKVQTLLADITRLVMSEINSRKAWREVGGDVEFVYERFAVLQSLGWIFKKRGVPWVLETNGIFFNESKSERKSLVLTNLAKKLEIKAYQNCDVLICVSKELEKLLIEKTGVKQEKILIVPNGVDTNFFNPDLYSEHREFNGFTIGFVGSLLEWQGLELLINAISELREEKKIIHLTIVGDGLERQKLQQLVKQRGLEDVIRFVGQISSFDVPNYISGFDIGYSGQIPLKIGAYYHSPLKLYEYMSMAKPVIASAFDDACKMIDGKNTGYLFEPGDLNSLKSALIKAYLSRDSLVSMGRRAREDIIKNHSWDARISEILPKIKVMTGDSKW